MERIFQNIPFLRITLAFAGGILLGNSFYAPVSVLLTILTLVLCALFFINKKYSHKLVPFFGATTHFLFLLLGAAVFIQYNKLPNFSTKGVSIGIILEKPEEKQNSYKSQVRIKAVEKNNSLLKTNETVLVYFEKSDKVKTIVPGMQIIFHPIPTKIENYGNPFEFDYKRFLNYKRIYRQVFLDKNSWQLTNYKSKILRVKSELLRESLLQIFRKQNLGKNETEILSALTLGYKRNLDRETKLIFSAAGVMHVLAVSGLHVGIIFLVFSLFFNFLRKQKTGRYIFIISSISLLWFYAFITGLSPSVLRATTMFSIVIIGTNINRRANIYNSLAASALFLLLINPNNLFEVGFQLSYSAVFGIVFLQPKFEKLITTPNKVVKFFWTLLTVSLAAQIATFPLTSFYFNQFPTYFWLSNLIVIPAVTVLVPLGIALLMLSKTPLLSAALAFIVKWIIKMVYSTLQFIESLPGSTLDISLSTAELFLMAAFLFCIFLFIQSSKVVFLKTALTFLLVLLLNVISDGYRQYHSSEIIVFNNSSNITIQLIRGRKNYVVSQEPIQKNEFLFQQIQKVQRKLRLNRPVLIKINDSYEDNFLFLKNGVLIFNGKTICMKNSNLKLPPSFSPDYLIVDQNIKKLKLPVSKNTKIILTKYFPPEIEKENIHLLKIHGAFCSKW